VILLGSTVVPSELHLELYQDRYKPVSLITGRAVTQLPICVDVSLNTNQAHEFSSEAVLR